MHFLLLLTCEQSAEITIFTRLAPEEFLFLKVEMHEIKARIIVISRTRRCQNLVLSPWILVKSIKMLKSREKIQKCIELKSVDILSLMAFFFLTVCMSKDVSYLKSPASDLYK